MLVMYVIGNILDIVILPHKEWKHFILRINLARPVIFTSADPEGQILLSPLDSRGFWVAFLLGLCQEKI